MGSAAERTFHVKDVAIVGAGPCGLAAAKYLVAQGAFDSIVVYEQQPEVGGVWYYSDRPSPALHVPQVSPFLPPDPPIRSPAAGSAPVFPSPMYSVLHTNIPTPLMQFSDLAFPEGSLIFPTRETMQEYLVTYAQDVRHLIRFSTQVTDIRLRRQGDRDVWDLSAQPTASGGAEAVRTFDAVVVASGHYSTPYMPDIPNIRDFHRTHPGVITHAKLYRRPEVFTGKKVIVVGNSGSGVDVAWQISRVCGRPLLLSVRKPTAPEWLGLIAGCEEVPAIAEFLVESRGVRFQDGRVETDVDAVIFCTGYLFSFPFLQTLDPPLVTNGRRVYGLYKDLVHIAHPTLAFAGLPIKVVPFPLSESQAAVFSRVWANAVSLPSTDEMHRWEEEQEQKRGDAFHVYPKGADIAYINETHDWITRASSRGKEPPRWGDKLVWIRQNFLGAKITFERTGWTATSLEELGLHYPEPSHAPSNLDMV